MLDGGVRSSHLGSTPNPKPVGLDRVIDRMGSVKPTAIYDSIS